MYVCRRIKHENVTYPSFGIVYPLNDNIHIFSTNDMYITKFHSASSNRVNGEAMQEYPVDFFACLYIACTCNV